MPDDALTTALDTYCAARRYFDQGRFETARQYIHLLDKLDFSFATVVAGNQFAWRPNSICIVAHRELSQTRRLLQDLATLWDDPDFSPILVSNSREDLFPYADTVANGRFYKICLGGNFGPSIGRNGAIKFSESDTITFIDDDGITTPSAIRNLIETRNEYDATAVRGRVLPIHNFDNVPKHYDLGPCLKHRFADIEGMTTWKLAALKEFRFDPLLYGHEGVELTARLYPVYGADAFIYEPRSILEHDFAKTSEDLAKKNLRSAQNDAFISQSNPDFVSIKSVFYGFESDSTSSCRLQFRKKLATPCNFGRDRKISIVTTCFNNGPQLGEYCKSIARQTCGDFDVVFVDDGSTDNSVELVKEYFKSDSRIKIVKMEHGGRSAALNFALSKVETELAVIADADDVSVPQRIDWTLRAFHDYPDADLIGFTIFDKNSSMRGTRPLISSPVPISVRRYFGMPCPFPGLGFKPSSFKLPFDESLAAGVDCDWLHKNIEAGALDGIYLPAAVTFYCTHEGQLTARRRDLQRRVSLKCVRNLHERLIGAFSPTDEEGLELFTGWKPIATGADWHRMKFYADRLVVGLWRNGVPGAQLIQDEIVRHVDERRSNLAMQDQRKFRARAEKAEETIKSGSNFTDRLTKLNSKLAWNRRRVAELEREIAMRQPAAFIKQLLGGLKRAGASRIER